MHDLVVIGGNGMLGRAWGELLTARGVDHLTTTTEALDITEPDAVAQAIRPGVEWVVNCAAYTAVDQAEAEATLADEVNGHAVGQLAERCREVGAKLLHYSTDYVFDGTASSPYRADHPRNPVNAYGRSKALGEQLLESSGCEYLLVRTSWLYAPWAKNFVLTIAGLAKSREELLVVDDQRGRPTDCRQLAEVSLQLATEGARGTYHVADGGECTWFDLAQFVVGVVNPSCQVRRCKTEDFPRPAQRPSYSVLDLTDTAAVVGALTPWKERVRDLLSIVAT